MSYEKSLSIEFTKAHLMDAVRILERLPIEETASFLVEIPPALAADVSKWMEPIVVSRCLAVMDSRPAAEIITRLSMEIAAILLRRMEQWKREAILRQLSSEIVESFEKVLSFPEESVGALMNPQVFTLLEDITVREASKKILRQPKHVLYYIFVVTRQHQFVGSTNIRELMLAKPNEPISSIMHTGVSRVSPYLHRDAMLAHPGWRESHDLPVVDEKGIFLGAVSYPTIRRLESYSKESAQIEPLVDASIALGELYWIGLSAFFKGATTAGQKGEK